MEINLPSESKLPKAFIYPEPFLNVIKLDLINLEPWIIMNSDQVVFRMQGLKKRYPTRVLVPFAKRLDNDDLACFELEKGERVQVIHDFASIGFEQRKEFNGFWDWFRDAIDEMIEFD
ncbi:hypothetical protein IC620_15045 [Hazenella sp. IB182357]|uniref:Uncharacterized protein n=1 Tax=Polycladospora coralii TaxID=2771432 RepID=A0A926NCD2_9BACL|nr:hypothetical protein [Polycladospora coralii]MBD1373662.1 hypothetical protein [Polycladospora coralii]